MRNSSFIVILLSLLSVITINILVAAETDSQSTSLNKTAQEFYLQGNYSEALKLYQEALMIQRKTSTNNNLDVAISLNGIANVYSDQGNYSEALKLYQESLVIRMKIQGNDHPNVATILNGIALIYSDHGNYAEALKLHQQALEIYRKKLGNNHPDVVGSINNIANIYCRQKKYSEALKLYQEALAIQRQTSSNDNLDVATSLNGIAHVYFNQGNYSEALKLYQESLAIQQKKLGDDHPDVASSLSNIANIYADQGNYSEALKLYQESLAIRRKKLGDDNLDVADSLNNIAVNYSDQGNYSESLKFHHEALALRRKKLGNDNLDVADSLNNIGGIHYDQGNYSESLKFFREALAIRREKLGNDHPKVAESLNNIAVVYKEQGNYCKALKFHKKALKIRREKLGDDHLDIAGSLNNIGAIHYNQENYSEALKFFQESLAIRWKKLGGDHPDVASSLSNVASTYSSQGNYVEALNFYQKALAIRREKLGDDHPDVAASLIGIANIYSAQGNYSHALILYQEVLAIQREKLGDNHPKVAISLNNIGGIHYDQGNYSEALKFFREALAIQREKLGDDHPDTARSLNDIANIYSDRGNYSEALKLYQDALEIRQKTLGENHHLTLISYKVIADCYQQLGNSEKAAYFYTKSGESSGKADIVEPRLDSLWGKFHSNADATAVLNQYYDLLKNSLNESNSSATLRTMKEMRRLYGNSEAFERDLVQRMEQLEKELRTRESLPAYFLFLESFSDSGFSELLSEQRKMFFGDLEEKTEKLEEFCEDKLTALTLLASDYLRDETFFADGLNYASQGVSVAEVRKDYQSALGLYRLTLRQQLILQDPNFDRTLHDAQRLAEREKNVKYQKLFALQKFAYVFQFDSKAENAQKIVECLKQTGADGRREIWTILERSRNLLNSGTPEIILLLKNMDGVVIREASVFHRRQIAFLMEYAGEHAEAKRWFNGQLSAIDQLLYLHATSSCDDLNVIKQNAVLLSNMTPQPFKMEGSNYSKEDMDLLISLTRSRYAKRQFDDAAFLKYAKHAEELIESGKCDRSFVLTLKDEIDACLGDYYYMHRDFESAHKKFALFLEKCPESDVRYPWYLMQNGMCYLAKNENKDAAAQFQRAGDLFLQRQKRLNAATAYRNQACALYRMGQYNDALAAIRQCIQLGKDRKDPSDQINKEETQINKEEADAVLLVEMKMLVKDTTLTRKEKEEKFQLLQKRIQRSGSSQVRCEFLLASALFTSEVVRHPDYEAMIRDLESYFNYKASIADDEWLKNPCFILNGDEIAKKLLFATLRRVNTRDAIAKLDYWNKKFERSRVQYVSTPLFDDEEEKENSSEISLLKLIEELQAAQEIVDNESQKPEASRDKHLLQSANATKRRAGAMFETKKKLLSREKQAQFAELLADSFVIPADALNQLSSVLEPGTVCLQFIPMDDEIIVYIVAHNTEPVLHTISLKKHSLTGRNFLVQLKKMRIRMQDPDAEVQKELKATYDVLMADLMPSLEKLKVQKFLINATGVLRYIPFAALYDGQQYLVEKYQITNVTGLDLVRLSKAETKRDISTVKAVVFADPDGSLPLAQEEAKLVASLFPQNRCFVEGKATLDELEALAGDVNFLHFATHSIMDANHPRKSHILLANKQKWFCVDMSGFNIKNVDSIVLSACKTAVGEKNAGEEIEGMAYQLLKKSPSGSVLASFWDVDDSATKEFMKTYYTHVTDSIKTKNILDRGGALRKAQLALLHTPATSSPFYWAAFTLYGDFR